jgi:NAD(P)-dependent dehydrogenase (short-subunit alcohol dehydrogenase family)
LAYGASKTANILFNTYLASHLKDKGVESFALQPGSKCSAQSYSLLLPLISAFCSNNVCLPKLPSASNPSVHHTQTDEGPAAFAEAGRILQEKYGGRPQPSGDLAGDVKTLEQASSTLLAAALNPELDGTYPAFEFLIGRRRVALTRICCTNWSNLVMDADGDR